MALPYDGFDHKWILGLHKGPAVMPRPAPPAPAASAPVAAAPPPKPGPVELKVPMCCEGCEKNVYGALIRCEGVESVKVDMGSKKVTITGKVKPEEMLKRVRKVKISAELWPQPPKKPEAKPVDKKP